MIISNQTGGEASGTSMTQEVKQRRIQCNYQPENARFLLECDFSKQYDRYYRKRLDKTRPFLEYNCRAKWDPNIPIYNLSEVANFATTTDTLDSETGSPIDFSSPESSNELFSNYKFKKRLRKFSGSQQANDSKQPQTSTQNKPTTVGDDDDELMFSDDDIDLTSPIIGAQRVQQPSVSPSVRKPAGSKSARCIVIGTIFKRMKLQPDVVDELSRGDFHVKCEKYLGHYTSQDDTLVLEDHEESIQLVGNINPKRFVTGITVALLGVSVDDGSQFMVFDICFAEPNRELLYDEEQLQAFTGPPPEVASKVSSPCFLMIVSDLGFHHEMDKKVGLTRALQNMIDFIWGGGKYSEDQRSSQVGRILVAGNSLHEDRFAVEDDELEAEALALGQDEIMFKMKQSRQVKQYAKSIQATKHMDDFFAQLSKTIHIDIMPGPSDPSSHLMPQQPFHPCMFPQSCSFSTFNCTTNPNHAIYNDSVEILATAGQNVSIIEKFSGLKDPIEIMKCHLLWGNGAPSAPDNLYSVPYEDEDPFVIDFIPDVYVVGCQKEFKVDHYHYTSSESRTNSQKAPASNTSFGSHMFDASPNIGNSATASCGKRNSIQVNNCETPKIGIASPDRISHQTAGGAPGTATNQLAAKRQTVLISVPRFFETFSCVLLDLVRLETQLISFK